jgi:hypothetical protein
MATDLNLVFAILFFIISLVLGAYLWQVRVLAKKLFGSLKNYFLKNKGFGNVYVFNPNNKMVRYYTNLVTPDQQVEVNGRRYTVVPEKIFDDDLGISSILVYLSDTEPMTPKEHDKSNNMIRSATFWSNLSNMIKMYAELKASKDAGLILLLVIFVLVLVFIVVGMNGYILYQLKDIIVPSSGGVVPI